MTESQAVCHLSDALLRQTVIALAGADRRAVLDLVDHLAEVDRRQLHLAWGFSSLWDYCDRELSLKDGVAALRITLARLIQRRPEVRPCLTDGTLGPSAACLLVDVAEAEDFAELLARARGMSKRTLESHLAERRGRPAPKRDVIRRIATAPLRREEPASPLDLLLTSPSRAATQGNEAARDALSSSSTALPNAAVTEAPARPIDPQLKTHRVSFLASNATVEKLKRAQDLAGASELADVLDKALDAYLARKDPKLRVARREARQARLEAKQKAPRQDRRANLEPRPVQIVRRSEPRRQPAALRDATLLADDERCSFVGPGGTRCDARRHLQIDHVLPWALGGSSTDPVNQRTLCKAHNLYAARQVFGGRVPTRPVRSTSNV